MRKTMTAVACVTAAMLALGACSSAPDKEDTGSAATDFTACMVSDSGGFDDKSFNQGSYEGLQKAVADFGIKSNKAESKSDVDYGPNITAMTSEGCNITVTVGFMLSDATKAAAEANKDAHFAIVDDDAISLPNVKPLVFKTSEAAYLAGYVAAATSKTGKVATYGGMNFPTVSIFMDGFADGVARYNADKGGTVQLLGWDKAKQDGSFAGSFDDQAKGQALAKTFMDQGADIIMPVAGQVGLGTIAAVKEAAAGGAEVGIVWVDTDGAVTNPDATEIFLTTVVKEIGAAVHDSIKATIDGGFSADPYVGTLANGGVSIAPYHDWDAKVSDETKAEVEKIQADIISGALVVDSVSNPK